MKSRLSRTEQLLAELEEQYLGRVQTKSRISRRELLRSSAGGAVVTVVGMGGLLELLANREAIAQNMLISIVGVTRERMPTSETPHRHLFSVRYVVTHVDPENIIGNVSGRAGTVISTSAVEEDQHFHIIERAGVPLEQLLQSGPENNERGGHTHFVSIE